MRALNERLETASLIIQGKKPYSSTSSGWLTNFKRTVGKDERLKSTIQRMSPSAIRLLSLLSTHKELDAQRASASFDGLSIWVSAVEAVVESSRYCTNPKIERRIDCALKRGDLFFREVLSKEESNYEQIRRQFLSLAKSSPHEAKQIIIDTQKEYPSTRLSSAERTGSSEQGEALWLTSVDSSELIARYKVSNSSRMATSSQPIQNVGDLLGILPAQNQSACTSLSNEYWGQSSGPVPTLVSTFHRDESGTAWQRMCEFSRAGQGRDKTYIADQALTVITRICRTRTLLGNSSYDSIVRMSCEIHIESAIKAVISLYTGVRTTTEPALAVFVHGLKQEPRTNVKFAILLLLVHFCVVKGLVWARAADFLAWMQSQGTPLHLHPHAMFPTYEVILNIFSPHKSHCGLNIDWLQKVYPPDQVLDLGLSPRLLFYIGKLTEWGSREFRDEVEQRVLSLKIKQLQQTVSGVEGDAKLAICQIARSYQLAAQLVALIRLEGFTWKHDCLRSKARKLSDLIFQLPSETSPLHRAMDPLFSVAVCSLVCTDEVADRLVERMSRISRVQHCNVPFAMAAVGWMRKWQRIRIHEEVEFGWFEDLRRALPEKFHAISLG